jgi:hypothetical protein
MTWTTDQAANLVSVHCNETVTVPNSHLNFNNTATINCSIAASTSNGNTVNVEFNVNTSVVVFVGPPGPVGPQGPTGNPAPLYLPTNWQTLNVSPPNISYNVIGINNFLNIVNTSNGNGLNIIFVSMGSNPPVDGEICDFIYLGNPVLLYLSANNGANLVSVLSSSIPVDQLPSHYSSNSRIAYVYVESQNVWVQTISEITII